MISYLVWSGITPAMALLALLLPAALMSIRAEACRCVISLDGDIYPPPLFIELISGFMRSAAI